MKTILYTFAGRRPNMQLQIPFVKRILERHPEVEWHIWNLTHDPGDDAYLRTIAGERITVINTFADSDHMSWRRLNDVWRHYTAMRYQNTRFVKLDDDVVFIETERFGQYLENIRTHPEQVVSAAVVNNGACTRVFDGFMSKCFEPLDIPMLDVHLYGEYARRVHEMFLDNPNDYLRSDIGLVPTEEWLSINAIGFTFPLGLRITGRLQKRSPSWIKDRPFVGISRIGDEGAANVSPMLIDRSMVVAHLTFGPQVTGENKLLAKDWTQLRKRYAQLGKTYLKETA